MSETAKEVWIGSQSSPDGGSQRAVLADRESAERWIRWQHFEASRSAASHFAYERTLYTERLAKAETPERRAWCEAKIAELPEYPTDIEETALGFYFSASYYERVSISRERVEHFDLPEVTP